MLESIKTELFKEESFKNWHWNVFKKHIDIVEFNKTGFVEEKSPTKTGEVKNNKPFKVGDKVIFKDAFKSITGVISNIDGEYYLIAYQNKKGVDKILKTYETTFITKIE